MRISEERERTRDRLTAMSGERRPAHGRAVESDRSHDGRGDDHDDIDVDIDVDIDEYDDFADSRPGRHDDLDVPNRPRWLDDGGEYERGSYRSGLHEYDPYDDGSASRSPRSDLIPEHWRGMRWRPNRTGVIALMVVAVVAVAIGLFAVWWDSPTVQSVPPIPVPTNVAVIDTSGAAAPSSVPVAAIERVVVSVVGWVVTPGLVDLPAGSRVADALGAAGGVLDGGDTIALNLAQKLTDGDQIVVGRIGEMPSSSTGGEATPSSAGAPTGGTAGGLVNLNTATEQELDGLPGVGPVTAGAIVAWRSANGKFTDVEQLGEIDGIGPARLAKLRTLVSV
ncbi:competence protein ComEA [Rhodococcus sp. 27YEA15]|uniref:helix-hairpin-helix domain-containing protein n=1 Tax=Rhodococcus sp. 27YEA15 TaxID=3156259 RepID=UPI003C7BB618